MSHPHSYRFAGVVQNPLLEEVEEEGGQDFTPVVFPELLLNEKVFLPSCLLSC